MSKFQIVIFIADNDDFSLRPRMQQQQQQKKGIDPTDRMRNDGSGNDHQVDMGHKLTAPPDFDGPTTSYERRFTDLLCMALLWAMWISMTALGVYAMKNGDYRVMLHPLDYAGNRE